MSLLPGPDDHPDDRADPRPDGHPGRDEPRLRLRPAAPLSPWERDVLSRLEADLGDVRADPDPDDRSAGAPLTPSGPVGAIAGVIALVVVVSLLSVAGWALLALVAALVVPRLLLLALVGRSAR